MLGHRLGEGAFEGLGQCRRPLLLEGPLLARFLALHGGSGYHTAAAATRIKEEHGPPGDAEEWPAEPIATDGEASEGWAASE